MDHQLFYAKDINRLQYDETNQPFSKNWEQIAKSMLGKNRWTIYEAINRMCGFRPNRPCFTFDPSENSKTMGYRPAESIWKLDEIEGRYWKIRNQVEEGIKYAEFQTEPKPVEYDVERSNLAYEKIHQERLKMMDGLEPDDEIPIPITTFIAEDMYPGDLLRTVKPSEFLSWAASHLESIPKVFQKLSPGLKNSVHAAVRDHHEDRRDSTWAAITLILLKEGIQRYVHQTGPNKGDLNISHIADRLGRLEQKLNIKPLKQQSIRNQYNELKARFEASE